MAIDNNVNESQLTHHFKRVSGFVEDIISTRLPFIIRNGIVFILCILLGIIGVCYFIKYPDIVPSSARLTSINAPKPVIIYTPGKLEKLLIKEDATVVKNEILGFVEATADHKEVLRLAAVLDTVEHLIARNASELIIPYLQNSYTQLGELQQPYQTFSLAFFTFKNYLANGFYLRKKNMLAKDMVTLQRLHTNITQQRSLQGEDLALQQKTFDANESLKADKVISDFDYRIEKSKLIGKKMSLPQMDASMISNEGQQNEKQKEVAELENTINQQKAIFLQALHTFKSQTDDWKKKYVLMAPIDGKVAFASFIEENQQMQAGQTLCFINPVNSQYFVQITIPQNNFGKVAIGQDVLLKFPSYPFQEYGALKGRIAFISHITSDSGYLAKVTLVDGLTTNHKKQIQYRDGLLAQGEIITKDIRLLQRFYNSILGKVR